MSLASLLPDLASALAAAGFNFAPDAVNPVPGETVALLAHDRSTTSTHPQTSALLVESTYILTALHAAPSFNTAAAQAHVLSLCDLLLSSLPAIHSALSSSRKILSVSVPDLATDLDDSTGQLEAQFTATLVINHLLNY